MSEPHPYTAQPGSKVCVCGVPQSEHGPPFLAVFEVYREMNGAHLTAGDMADDLNAAIAAIEFDETEPGRERAVRYLDEQAMEAQHLHEWLRSGGGS